LEPFAQVCQTKLRWIFLQQTHPIHSIGRKTPVLARFGLLHYGTTVDAKLAELALLIQKFAKQSCVEIFHNERTRSTPLDPKLLFWRVSDRLKVNAKLAELAPLLHKFAK
jgi:hypothetical protein